MPKLKYLPETLLHWMDKFYGFELTKLISLLIFRILRHNDVKTIIHWIYEFRFKIKVSNFVFVLNFNL